ncbi:protein phosphatase 2C domain-containing protein [Actinospica sp. MGRD01-02]|uniref:Protein phosphatase 2C domain-containing protein n=1 Tax=Actinospica acidithermotolerans TaxID=2828514 RepID=A0A941ECH1_9ACTN|nr:protein phosphatase 2C domain-containing protein [Actinospica acidithermotolerans]MBR7827932.1 protein phosphatase 2C domain-containing protein [Actinospica acidithermotolerans]
MDRAISKFEPQPPIRTGLNRADTEFDGWSSPELTLRSASVRGYLHRHNGKPRQDAVETAYHPRTRTVVFAVADGVSSAPRAELGAVVACQAFVANLIHQLDLGQVIEWQQAVDSTVDALLVEGSRLPGVTAGDPSQIERQLATTLVAGTIWPTDDGMLLTVLQIGDSTAWILDREGYHPLLASKNERPGGVVSNAVSPLPRRPQGPIAQARLNLTPGQVLLVGTDGFGDPLGDGDGLVGELFRHHLLPGPPPAVGLAHLLDFSRELFDDDRTLLALWPLAQARGSSG